MKTTNENRKGTVKMIENNPCFKEHQLSLKCLDEGSYNRDRCFQYFENYKKCREFWLFVYKERRKKGIRPYLPVPEDRPAVQQEYMPYFKGY